MGLITQLNRRKLFDAILLNYKFEIFGRLEITDFLARIFDIDNMPSSDSRFSNARGDIWQHMINNDDWELDYLLINYLDLLNCDKSLLFKFIEETVHPAVQDDNVAGLVNTYNVFLQKDGYKLIEADSISDYPIYRVLPLNKGVQDDIKNIIFSADGPKPEIVIEDTLSNNIKIVKNSEYCLVYDKKISDKGLLWIDLVEWWGSGNGEESRCSMKSLYKRLSSSLNAPEKIFFDTYYRAFYKLMNDKLPALVPQVYLHYDPYTIKQLKGERRLSRQRMDFLMIFSSTERVVIEIDGKQHYSNGDISCPELYSEMVEMDRTLKLWGYEVYRFGGYEFTQSDIESRIESFFIKLLNKHGKLED